MHARLRMGVGKSVCVSTIYLKAVILYQSLLASFKGRYKFEGVRAYVSAIHISPVTDFIKQQWQLFHSQLGMRYY